MKMVVSWDVSRLDTTVTVVDAANFLNHYSSNALKDHGETSGEDDNRAIVDLMVEQVEFANVILLIKIDLVTVPELKVVKVTWP